jgi:aryl-alcohol dehydrogenase-like predicted oxidoreductase
VIATAPFGHTGHTSTRVIFGAAALGRLRQERADAILQQLLDAGINHLDTAAMYGDSELRIGPWMADHRDHVFLATKTGQRRGDDARAELERSLQRLQVDSVDLIQLHNLVEPEEWEVAHGPGGALESLVQARDEGLVRHIGVTGHGTRIARMHLRSLQEFPFASVLLPFSFVALQDDAYRADVEELLAVCADRGVAVQTIKAIGRRRWPEGHDGPRFSWYEPITDPAAIGRAVRWVLSHDQLFLNTSSDATLLPIVLDAAAALDPVPSDAELQADLDAHDIHPLFDGEALERI